MQCLTLRRSRYKKPVMLRFYRVDEPRPSKAGVFYCQTPAISVNRPLPPAALFEPMPVFVPAPDVANWIRSTFLDDGGALLNEEHAHLRDAMLGVLWTSYPNASKGRTVLGMAEMPMFRCGAWQRGRQEQQLFEWFGDVPDFLITLDAQYSAQSSDVEFCALIEHELFHCAQALNEFGLPRFNKSTGKPVFTMRGHDVEEFVGVVRRYGITSQAMRDMFEAAKKGPEIATLDVARACGTCLLKSA